MFDYTIGYASPPDPPRYFTPECPCCGRECNHYFLDINGAIIGCDECHDPEDDFDNVADAYQYHGEFERLAHWGF